MNLCVVPFPYPMSIYLTKTEKPYCFNFGTTLFAGKNLNNTQQLCIDMRRLFAPPDVAHLSCPFECNCHFSNILALHTYVEVSSTVGNCTFFTQAEQERGMNQNNIVFISRTVAYLYYVRKNSSNILDTRLPVSTADAGLTEACKLLQRTNISSGFNGTKNWSAVVIGFVYSSCSSNAFASVILVS